MRGAWGYAFSGLGSSSPLIRSVIPSPLFRYAGHASHLRDIPSIVSAAFQAATSGRPGAAYVGLPSNVLLERLPPGALEKLLTSGVQGGTGEE